MSLETQLLTHIYPGRIVALRGISLQIRKGEFVAIMGENGAGKTTLVKHFNGLLKPSRGRVLIDGLDSRKAHVAKLSLKVGLAFQNPDHQIFAGTVFDEIAFGLERFNLYRLQKKKRVGEVAAQVGLTDVLEQSPYALSMGDRKRVALASVLAWNPEIVILDEPTIGLDALLKGSLHRVIQDLRSEGRTVLMISHDVEFVANLNPRVILMRQGVVIADGPAENILTDAALVDGASLVLPQITQILYGFDGLTHNVLDLDGAVDLIQGRKPGGS